VRETVAVPEIDKSGWPPGPWHDEPDRVEFVHAGYACLVTRHPRHGHLCGCVGVDASHPYFGKGYDDCAVEKAHGGLTYAERCNGSICHVPEPGMPDEVWWLGFDCAHAGDLSPGILAFELTLPKLRPFAEEHLFEDSYRDLAYVRRATQELADELRAKAG
jgi:hypothetical protein